MEIYDRPSVRLRLKVRMLEAEAIDTIIRVCHMEPEQGSLYMAETKARRPHPVRCQRASKDTL